MKMLLERVANVNKGSRQYVIGHLYNVTDGKKEFICDTLEDIDRGLDQSLGEEKCKKLKVYSKTAIPTGTYDVTTKIVSGTFSKKAYYKKSPVLGRVPRLLNVPAYNGILMHCGTNETHSAGCILVGYNKVVGALVESTKAFEKLYAMLGANTNGHSITITRKYNC